MKVSIIVKLQNINDAKMEAIHVFKNTCNYPIFDIEITKINTIDNTITFTIAY